MTSPWVVTTSTDRIVLDEQRRSELTFTVTNVSSAADRAVFEPVPGHATAHGRFDAIARRRSWEMWTSRHRGTVALGALVLGGLGLRTVVRALLPAR